MGGDCVSVRVRIYGLGRAGGFLRRRERQRKRRQFMVLGVCGVVTSYNVINVTFHWLIRLFIFDMKGDV